MSIKKINSGYEVRFRVNGRGSRAHKKVFPTKAECERFQRYIIAQFETQADAKLLLEKSNTCTTYLNEWVYKMILPIFRTSLLVA
ncbi:hypothetical protein EBI01_18090 [Marinomonas rhizomae]|uniref:Uncharacterized protein n=1 Tax=Marinomonas rhizomae TaxID=491948 RepID=A0A366IXU7_9GAMM|nr:hypothetical protein [Marinomonas rhizomae]RBP78528.1 hypothetical protein DFP80_11924 [Marinomonas rhizomae]RNF70099.1 hypothetical protein EBI01_18090 [Marinomonas rhizomae]